MATRKGSDNVFPKLLMSEVAAPSTPASGTGVVYLKSDGKLYWKDDGGNEHVVSDDAGVNEYADLTDVDVTGLADGDIMYWDDGDGAWKPAAPPSGGGGGGTLAYLGYNTVGGSAETLTDNRVYMKKITVTNVGALLAIELHLKETSDTTQRLQVALHADVAGAVGDMIASNESTRIALTNTSGFASNYRWFGVPLTASLAATSYWLAWQAVGSDLGGSDPDISLHYDGSGSDRYYDAGDRFMTDGGRYSETDSTRKYSVRALVLEV